MRHKLLNLLAANRGRGFFKAEVDAEKGNVIYLYDVIVSSDSDADWFGGVSAESVVKAMAGMQGPVTAHINSPGGDVFGGQAVANAFRAYDGEITAVVDGYAASAAASIAIAADKVVMGGDGAMFMIHKAWTLGFGNADELRSTADLLDKIDGRIANSVAAKTGKTPAEIMALLSGGDTWFTADEAVEFGLADEIAAGKDKAAQNARQPKWDLSAYGRDEPASERLTLKLDASDLRNALADAIRDLQSDPAAVDDEARARRIRENQVRLLTA